MGSSPVRKGVLSRALRWIGIVVILYLVQLQILELRKVVHAQTAGLAQIQGRTHHELGRACDQIELSIEGSSDELSRTRDALRESVQLLREERDRLMASIDGIERQLRRGAVERGERQEGELRRVEKSVARQARRIDELSQELSRDPGAMKRAMIFPTLQLRGNGTVGSGVLIYSRSQPGLEGRCTTFAITACHVVEEVVGGTPRAGSRIEEVRVFEPEGDTVGERVAASVILHDTARDTALLRLDTARPFRYLARLLPRERLASLDVFSPAYAVGCPLGNRPMPTLGQISSRFKKVGAQVFWMLTAPTFYGNSGGGVYLAPGYELIGVSSMIYTYGKSNPTVVPHMGLFVPLESVRTWLEEAGYGFVLKRRPIPESLVGSLAWKGLEVGSELRAGLASSSAGVAARAAGTAAGGQISRSKS